jgi:hypothetical protein
MKNYSPLTQYISSAEQRRGTHIALFSDVGFNLQLETWSHLEALYRTTEIQDSNQNWYWTPSVQFAIKFVFMCSDISCSRNFELVQSLPLVGQVCSVAMAWPGRPLCGWNITACEAVNKVGIKKKQSWPKLHVLGSFPLKGLFTLFMYFCTLAFHVASYRLSRCIKYEIL